MDAEVPTSGSPGVAPIGFEMVEQGISPTPQSDQLYPPVASNGPAQTDPAPSSNANSQRHDPEKGQTGTLEQPPEESLFFDDGKRKIDYVLVYADSSGNGEDKKQQKRDTFLANLRAEGLELEHAQRQKTHFVKIHAPWEVLTRYAELTNMKMPLAENDMTLETTSCWSKCPTPFDYDESILPDVPDYFTAPFSRERVSQFVVKNKDTFFTSAQRSYLVYQILARTVYEDLGDSTRNKFGIKKLLNAGAYDACFPLHEGDYTSEHSILTRGKANDRHLLYETWAKPSRWYKFQPLDHIRKYFGEKIAIYFTWLGYYTQLLIPAAILGLVAFFYGVGTLNQNEPSKEICDEKLFGNLTMCPLCDQRCNLWQLKRSCTYSRVTYLFDNEATMVFAAFMALWAVFFHEMWKRRQAEIEYDWDVADFEEEETVRPEYEASVRNRKRNPVNQMEEPYLPLGSRCCRYLSSLIVVLFMLCVVVAAVFGVIVYRITVAALLYGVDQSTISQRANLVTSATAALINLVIIIILGRVYQAIALQLTNFETHRTQTEWEDSFTLKMFLFQFVNHYSSLFYIAFFKGRFVGRPGDYNRSILGTRQEECDPAGCLIELCIQLGIIMVGKQTFNNFKEIVLPKFMNWIKSRKVKEDKKTGLAQWEEDNTLSNLPDLGLFDEYLEMVLQFGFISIFVAAFPIAPFFALLNNIIEVRLDAYKFVTQWKRPFAARAQDIGIWFGILKGITTIAILSNAAIIGFTSEFIPKLVYRYGYDNNGSLTNYTLFSLSKFAVKDFEPQSMPKNSTSEFCMYRDYRNPPGPNEYEFSSQFWHVLTARLAFIIIFVMTVVFLSWFISYMVPDVPHGVRMQMLREKHLSREAVLEAETVIRRRSPAKTNGADTEPQTLY